MRECREWGLCDGNGNLSVLIYYGIHRRSEFDYIVQIGDYVHQQMKAKVFSAFQTARAVTGATMVEFALVATLLLTVLFGTLDFGWAFFANTSIANGAREGARKAIVCTSCDAAIRQRVRDTTPGLALPDSNILISYHTDSGTKYVTVTVTYNYTPLTPFVSRFFPSGSLTLTGKSTMYDE